MDVHLNPLFNTSINAEQFLNTHLLTLPSHLIMQNYIKLTSLKHAITKNIHKEI